MKPTLVPTRKLFTPASSLQVRPEDAAEPNQVSEFCQPGDSRDRDRDRDPGPGPGVPWLL